MKDKILSALIYIAFGIIGIGAIALCIWGNYQFKKMIVRDAIIESRQEK